MAQRSGLSERNSGQGALRLGETGGGNGTAPHGLERQCKVTRGGRRRWWVGCVAKTRFRGEASENEAVDGVVLGVAKSTIVAEWSRGG